MIKISQKIHNYFLPLKNSKKNLNSQKFFVKVFTPLSSSPRGMFRQCCAQFAEFDSCIFDPVRKGFSLFMCSKCSLFSNWNYSTLLYIIDIHSIRIRVKAKMSDVVFTFKEAAKHRKTQCQCQWRHKVIEETSNYKGHSIEGKVLCSVHCFKT